MKLKIVFILMMVFGGSAFAQNSPSVQFRLGAGTTFSPFQLLSQAQLEYRLDDHLAIGVAGLFSSENFDFTETIFFPSLTGRLILPKTDILGPSAIKGPDFYLLTGAGYVRRELEGFIFNDAGFRIGAGLDYWMSRGIFFGIYTGINLIGSNVDRSFIDSSLSLGFGF